VNLSRRLMLAFSLAASLGGPALAARGVPSPDDMTLGRPKAPVSIVEYASLACPHCAHFNAEVFPALKARYVDTGKARYTLKEMLTAPAVVAEAGFLTARCAPGGPQAYFSVVDEIFRSQPRWQSGQIKPIFAEIAARHGVDAARLDACLTSEAAQAALEARIQAAENDGVTSTPAIFVNGQPVGGPGAVPTLPEIEAAIAAAGKTRRR